VDPTGQELELGVQLIEFVEAHLTSILLSIGALVAGVVLQSVGDRIVRPRDRP
jgi:hypothetical protein